MVHVSTSGFQPDYDRKAELTVFDETKTGVKGLIDAGITEVPRIFILPSPENLNSSDQSSRSMLNLPTIDLAGINEDPVRRKEVIEKVKDALESWGFFQMVNHGIPTSILEEMKEGVVRFHEQDSEVRKQWYNRDFSGKSRGIYNSNFDLYVAAVANWRDSFYCTMAPNPPQPHELPPTCRFIIEEAGKIWLISRTFIIIKKAKMKKVVTCFRRPTIYMRLKSLMMFINLLMDASKSKATILMKPKNTNKLTENTIKLSYNDVDETW